MSSGRFPKAHDHGASDNHIGEAFWNQRYRSSSAIWSGQPNPQLVTEAAGVTAGTAQDVGCGEGADAIWLAQHGWQVTAVDISPVALERAAAHAHEVGAELAGRITWLQADVTGWVGPPDSTYDLVSAQFMQLPEQQRALLHHRLAASVSNGGTLLIVGHSPLDLQTTAHRPPQPELFFTAAQVAASLDPRDWDIVVSEARRHAVLDPAGLPITVYDEVLNARRRPLGP